MDFTFHNVTITIPAIDSAEAYARLCSALCHIGAEFVTDTYSAEASPNSIHPTRELWPHLD